MVVPNSVLGFFGGEYTDAALVLQVLATGQFINLLTGPAALAMNMVEIPECASCPLSRRGGLGNSARGGRRALRGLSRRRPVGIGNYRFI